MFVNVIIIITLSLFVTLFFLSKCLIIHRESEWIAQCLAIHITCVAIVLIVIASPSPKEMSRLLGKQYLSNIDNHQGPCKGEFANNTSANFLSSPHGAYGAIV